MRNFTHFIITVLDQTDSIVHTSFLRNLSPLYILVDLIEVEKCGTQQLSHTVVQVCGDTASFSFFRLQNSNGRFLLLLCQLFLQPGFSPEVAVPDAKPSTQSKQNY